MKFIRFIMKYGFEISCALWLIVIILLMILYMFKGGMITI